MIQKQEILQVASLESVNPIIIEKDYVLGWLLAGISNNTSFAESWIFKGGTCLKKCYFEKYRFSEDLDFTLTETASLDPTIIRSQLSNVTQWIYEQAGIEFPEIILDVYTDSNGKTFRGKIGYIGPLQQRGSFTRIKLDLTQNELLVAPAIQSRISHPYGDQSNFSYHVFTYSYEELFAEKVRALLERARPRDLYDVIHLFERKDQHRLDLEILKEITKAKLAFRKLPFITNKSNLTKTQENDLIQDWENMLAHQIGHLEPIQTYLNKLQKILQWLK